PALLPLSLHDALPIWWWLLGTLGGRDFLLAQVVARLPAGTTLEWREAEGPASGPLTMHDVVFQQLVCPEVDDQPVPYGACEAPKDRKSTRLNSSHVKI